MGAARRCHEAKHRETARSVHLIHTLIHTDAIHLSTHPTIPCPRPPTDPPRQPPSAHTPTANLSQNSRPGIVITRSDAPLRKSHATVRRQGARGAKARGPKISDATKRYPSGTGNQNPAGGSGIRGPCRLGRFDSDQPSAVTNGQPSKKMQQDEGIQHNQRRPAKQI